MTHGTHLVLVVEDSDDDYLFLRRACRQIGAPVTLMRLRSADEARTYLEGLLDDSAGQQWPLLIFLDLNMPGTDGRTFLQELKSSEHFRMMPVVVYSTSTADNDILYCYSNHANAYHEKHLDYDAMKSELAEILEYWIHQVVLPRRPA